MQKYRMKIKTFVAVLCCLAFFVGYQTGSFRIDGWDGGSQVQGQFGQIEDYSGKAYVEVNGNIPEFSDEEIRKAEGPLEEYSGLDRLGRCGMAIAKVGKETMPIEERGSIGQIRPSGWHTVKYDSIDGKYLYNRCHLIGYQLTGENANEKT